MDSLLVNRVAKLEQLLQDCDQQFDALSSERYNLVCEQRTTLYQSSINVLNAFIDVASAAAVFRKNDGRAQTYSNSIAVTARTALGKKLVVLQDTFTQIDSAFSASREAYELLALRLVRYHNDDFLTLRSMIIATVTELDERLQHVTLHIADCQRIANGLSERVVGLETEMSLLEKKKLAKRESGKAARIVCRCIDITRRLLAD